MFRWKIKLLNLQLLNKGIICLSPAFLRNIQLIALNKDGSQGNPANVITALTLTDTFLNARKVRSNGRISLRQMGKMCSL